jgi:O-antigen ligase
MSQHGFRVFASRGFSFSSWGATGAPGWFRNSGEFGIQMTIFVPLAIAFIMALKEYWGRGKRWFFYLLPVTGLVSIVASSSRGAQLAIIVVGLWFLIRTRKGIKWAIVMLLVGFMLYLIMPEAQKARFDTMGEDQTSVERLEHWRLGMGFVVENPLLGLGYKNWLDYCNFLSPFRDVEGVSCHQAHNMYVECVAELGVPGLIVFLWMLLLMFRRNSRTRIYASRLNNKFIMYVSYGLDGGLVGFMVSGFFISVLYYPFFWFQLAMTVALNEVSKGQALELDRTGSTKYV